MRSRCPRSVHSTMPSGVCGAGQRLAGCGVDADRLRGLRLAAFLYSRRSESAAAAEGEGAVEWVVEGHWRRKRGPKEHAAEDEAPASLSPSLRLRLPHHLSLSLRVCVLEAAWALLTQHVSPLRRTAVARPPSPRPPHPVFVSPGVRRHPGRGDGVDMPQMHVYQPGRRDQVRRVWLSAASQDSAEGQHVGLPSCHVALKGVI